METNTIEPRESTPRWSWLGMLTLAALPIVLAVLGYYSPVFGGAALPSLGDDFTQYQYQFTRASEVGGRWWRVVDDPMLGGPFQSEVAKHPGFYEGVDLMLLCALPGRWLGPTRLYHFVALLIFASNGWAAGWMVRRLTGSYAWAALAVVLITMNLATVGRVFCGHPHLARHAWVVLACWAFARYLEKPSTRTGVILGLTSAAVLQSSFYLGYLLAIAMFTWWIGCLIANRVNRDHLAATLAAGLAFALAAAALTFPIWTVAKSTLLSDSYFERRWGDTWKFGAELWQYFLPNNSPLADAYFDQIDRFRDSYPEGWYFPGYSVLAAALVYVCVRLRGGKFPARYAAVIDVLMGLIAVSVVLSLTGGPSFFLFHIFPSFRVYGRAGSLALAAGSVAAPLVLCGLMGFTRLRVARCALVVAALGLMTTDALRPARMMNNERYLKYEAMRKPEPEWSDWLSRQPQSVHLAAFRTAEKRESFYWWGTPSLSARMKHGHVTLNGGDFSLIEADLKLLGASYEWLNPEAVRYIASIGFETLAFHEDYLNAHPWISRLPTLDWIETLGPWRIARANQRMHVFTDASIKDILAQQPVHPPSDDVPPLAWITGRLSIDGVRVVKDRSQTFMAWADSEGRLIEKPTRALFQHILGPSLPAFTVKTPQAPGRYTLVFLDQNSQRLGAKPYRVVQGLSTSGQAFGKNLPAISLGEAAWTIDSSAGRRLVYENKSPYYLQAHINRDQIPASVRAHPGFGLGAYDPGSVYLLVRGFAEGPGGGPLIQEMPIPLPHDLPPGGRVAIELSPDRVIDTFRLTRMTLSPTFDQLGQTLSPPEAADVRPVVNAPLNAPIARQAVQPRQEQQTR